MRKKSKYRMLFLTVGLFCLLFTGVTGAWSGQSAVETPVDGTEKISTDRRAKILSVLETRTADEKVIEKAAEKLRTLDGRELRLMASLCDRIEESGGTAGADIAFSLMTAMIVLS